MAKKQKKPLSPTKEPAAVPRAEAPLFERLERWLTPASSTNAEPGSDPVQDDRSSPPPFRARSPMTYDLLFILLLGAVFALLLFDTKISEGGDDSMYIEAAHRYARDYFGYFYWANAPLYPMMLGVVALATGVNLIAFKLVNTVLFLVHLWLMYRLLHRRFPALVTLPVLVLSAVNPYLLYYASQTYTEMLFLCLQTGFLIVFFKFIEKHTPNDSLTQPHVSRVTRHVSRVVPVAVLLLLLTLTKNIAIGMVGAVAVFLLAQRRYALMALVVGAYAGVRLAWQGLVTAVWGGGLQYGSQGSILLQKDAYDPSKGTEDLAGFAQRLITNLDLYASKRLPQILGFRDEFTYGTNTLVTMLVVVVTLLAGWVVWRRWAGARWPGAGGGGRETRSVRTGIRAAETEGSGQWAMGRLMALFIFIYIFIQLSLTFIVLQTTWDQARLILVYVPLWLLVVWYGLYLFCQERRLPWLYLGVVVVIVASSLAGSVWRAVNHFPVLAKNLQGDKYYGYTPDWENYLRMSEWAADSLPPGALVACRKAPMSFVYGKGREFFPVYTVMAVDPVTNMSHPDSVLQFFEENNITHVLLGSLRRNPKDPRGQIINTLHRMMQPVANTYPGKVTFVKKIGDTEPAYLYQVREVK